MSRPAGRPLRLALIVGVVVALVDQATKIWADRNLIAGPCTTGGDECIDLFWTARLHLHYNSGAAFSTGRGLGPIFGVIAFVMALVLLNIARTRRDRLGPILLGAIAGGAVGNLIDRIARAEDGPLSGSVIDFIDLQWWPIFNIADSAVVVGVISFVVYSLLNPDSGREISESTETEGTESESTETQSTETQSTETESTDADTTEAASSDGADDGGDGLGSASGEGD